MGRDELVRRHAEAAAARVDAAKYGIDPVTIITILTTVLPLIISCFKRNDEPDPQEVQAAVQRKCRTEAGYRSLLRKTTRRTMYESPEPITRTQAAAIARGIIEEAINGDASQVAALCGVVAADEYSADLV